MTRYPGLPMKIARSRTPGISPLFSSTFHFPRSVDRRGWCWPFGAPDSDMDKSTTSLTPTTGSRSGFTMRRGRQQLTDESLGQPGLETLRGPAPAMDQHVIRPGTEQPNNVCTAGLPQTRLHGSPSRREWSVNDVLAHLRSCADMWGNSCRPRRRILELSCCQWPGRMRALSDLLRT